MRIKHHLLTVHMFAWETPECRQHDPIMDGILSSRQDYFVILQIPVCLFVYSDDLPPPRVSL